MADTERYGQHYDFDYKGLRIDPYRILDLYNILHPAHQHAIKKLLRAGRSVKPLRQDIQEVIETLKRWIEMLEEQGVTKAPPIETVKEAVECKTCFYNSPSGFGCNRSIPCLDHNSWEPKV